jgi:phage-related protein
MAKGPGGFSVGRVSIQVVPDTSKFREKLLAELKKEIKGLKVEIPVDVDAAKAVAQLKALDSILKKLDGKNINIGARVGASGDLEKISKDLSKVGKSAGDASSGFSSLGRTGLIVVGVLLLIAPALAVISTLLAGLPSLMFAFGGAALAVGLGFEGIKKAASGFAPTIERLKKSLSGTFAKQLTQPFIELNKIAPVLDRGLNAIAVSLSGIVQDFVKFVTSGQGLAQMNEILQNTARFFNLLRPAIDDGMRALFFLASEASQEFDVLAATLRRFSASFLEMVKRVSGDGTLGSALRNLNIVLDSLLDAFVRFFEAGLKAMTVLGGPLTILFDGFTDAVVALMPIMTAISKLVAEVFGEAFKQLAPIVRELTPGIETLGKLLSTILVGALKVIGPLLTTVANILNTVLLKALTAIAPLIDPFIKFIGELALIIGDFLVAAFVALTPFLNLFVKFIQDLLIAVAPLLPVLIQFATEVLRTIADVLAEMGPDLVQLGEELFPRLLTVIKDLVPVAISFLKAFMDILPALTDLAVLILEVVVPAMSALFQTISEIWPSIKQIITGTMTAIQGVINVIMGIITGDWERIWEGIKQILSGAWTAIKGSVKAGLIALVESFISLPTRILNALIGLPNSLFSSGRSMIQGFINGVKSMAQPAIDAALAIVNKVRDLFPFSPAKTGPFSGTGYTTYSGKALMEDWAKGIEKGAPAAVAAVQEAMAETQNGMDISAAVTSEGFGDIYGQITSAMSGWEVVIDANGITKLVNKTNQKNSRR